MEKKTLYQKLIDKYFLPVYVAVVMTTFPYCLGRMVYDRATADKTIRIEDPFSPSTFHGFDDNKDGTIDRIVEYFPLIGARMGGPMRKTYTPEDKEFEHVKKVFDK